MRSWTPKRQARLDGWTAAMVNLGRARKLTGRKGWRSGGRRVSLTGSPGYRSTQASQAHEEAEDR